MWLWMVLTLLMCFLCKAAGTAVLQPHPWRFKSLSFAMSLGRAACLQSLNPLKTSSCVCGPILSISVYCFRIFIWEIGNFTLLGLTLKSTWDWQTNKHTVLKITNPVGRHHDGRIVSQRHPSDHFVLFPLHERLSMSAGIGCILTHCGRTPLLDIGHSICFQTEAGQCIFLWSVYLKYDIVDTYYGWFLAISYFAFSTFLRHVVALVWVNTEDCSRLHPACVIRPVISGGVMFGRSVHSERSGGSLMESGVCVMLISMEWNDISVWGGFWATDVVCYLLWWAMKGVQGDELFK